MALSARGRSAERDVTFGAGRKAKPRVKQGGEGTSSQIRVTKKDRSSAQDLREGEGEADRSPMAMASR